MASQLAVLISTLAECTHLEDEESTCGSQLSILSPHPDVLITAQWGLRDRMALYLARENDTERGKIRGLGE